MAPLSEGQFQPIPVSEYSLKSGDPQAFAHMAANFENTARNYLPKAKKSEIEFYDEHHKTAQKVGHGDVERGAGILAALSGGTEWGLNVAQAMEISHDKLHPGQFERLREQHDRSVLGGLQLNRNYSNQVLKAHDIHTGRLDPTTAFEGRDSMKTKNFQRALAHPDDPNAFVVDFRMHDIGVGRRLPVDANRKVRGPRYEHIASAGIQAARNMNMSAPEFQSLAWHADRARDFRGKRSGQYY